jgi:hypothetical protein
VRPATHDSQNPRIKIGIQWLVFLYDARRVHWRRGLLRMASPVLAIGLIGILIAAPNASGQAAVEQYIPQGDPAGGSGGAQTGQAVPGVPSDTLGPRGAQTGPHSIAAKPRDGSSSGDSVPLTSDPGTPFVWIVLAVLATGVLLRIAAPVLTRRRARGAP